MTSRIEASVNDGLVTALSGRIALLVIDMQRDYCAPGGVIDALGHDTSHFAGVGARIAKFLSRNRTRFRSRGLRTYGPFPSCHCHPR